MSQAEIDTHAKNEMELFNLHFGNERPPASRACVKVGPFKVTVKPNYVDLVNELPDYAKYTVSWSGEATFLDARKRGWVATADCALEEAGGCSILSINPIQDGGIWDLCQILTFLNGRCITADPSNERYSPNVFGTASCVGLELLTAASIIWDKREEYKRRNLVYALLLSNMAFSLNTVNAQAGLISAAFNAIYDDWRKQSQEEAPENETILKDLTDSEKSEIKAAINSSLATLTNISSAKLDALKPLLGGKVNQGFSSPVNTIQAMLSSLKIIPPKPDKKTVDRIKFINSVRNKFVHCGHPPVFTRKPELSIELSVFIVGRLLPDIVALYLGQVAGFTPQSVGSLAQHTYDLEQYFQCGTYGQWNVEEESFSEMIDKLAID